MGSPEFAATILSALVEKSYPPALVVTQSAKEKGRGREVVQTAVASLARSLHLSVHETDDINQDVDLLKKEAPELLLVAAFGQILKEPILTLPSRYCLNVHASLLPKWRGAAPIQRSLLAGDSATGVTIQKMAKKLDTGDILLKKEIKIQPKETSGTLTGRLAVLGAECLLESIRLIESGKEKFAPQNEAEATYAKKMTKEEAVIDWGKNADAILRQIYAFQPWPVAEASLGSNRLKIFAADLASENGQPGSVRTDGKTYLQICCGTGAVALTEVQLENRKRLPVAEFLRAYRGTFPFQSVGA